jgi:hypothetical protein
MGKMVDYHAVYRSSSVITFGFSFSLLIRFTPRSRRCTSIIRTRTTGSITTGDLTVARNMVFQRMLSC